MLLIHLGTVSGQWVPLQGERDRSCYALKSLHPVTLLAWFKQFQHSQCLTEDVQGFPP